MKITIADHSWNGTEVERAHLPRGAEIADPQARTEDEVIASCAGASAALAEYAPFTRRVLSSLPDLKIISNTASGYDNIDVEAARELGIAVANVPDYCVYEVAEHAMALALAVMRGVPGYCTSVRRGEWDFTKGPKLYRIHGSTMGLIGFGRIAKHAARIARGLGMEVAVRSRHATDAEAAEMGARLATLDELARVSDLVLCQVPLTDDTYHIADDDFFSKCERSPIFVCTSRGATYDAEALRRALDDGRVRAAALDVLEEEPMRADHPLASRDDVIITPHAAFYSEDALEEVRRRSAQNVARYLAGERSGISFVVEPMHR